MKRLSEILNSPTKVVVESTKEETIAEATKQDNNTIIDLLKNALKEELNAWYGYIIVKEYVAGPERTNVVKFFEETAKDELEDHAYWIMERISQLGGELSELSMSPNSWSSAKHQYIAPEWNKNNIDVKSILEINIKNEEGAIETYEELVKMTENTDPASNSKLKEILADEQQHLQGLKDFLADIK